MHHYPHSMQCALSYIMLPTTTPSTASISEGSGCMDSESTTGSTMDVTNTRTVNQLSPNSNYMTSQPSPNNTSLTATTTLTTTIASQPSPNNTSLTATTTLETPAFPSKPNAFTSTVLTSSLPPIPQSSYSFVNTDPIPTMAPGPLLTGVLSVVGILSIAAVITVVVLIVVIRRRKKAAMTVKNERYATLCSYTVSCKVW